jgi:hypothetical protein
MYDPEIGVWWAMDPKEQFIDVYLFCANNPVLYVDSTGEWSFKHFFSTFAAEIFRPFVEIGSAIREHDFGKFCQNFYFGLTIGGATLNMTEASGAATWAVLPDVQNKMADWGWINKEAGSHGDGGETYTNYINTQKKNINTNNPFTRWEAKGRIAHTTQDYKHHHYDSVVKGVWYAVLSEKGYIHFEDVAPLVPDFPFMNTFRVWEGASDYYQEVYGDDLGFNL